MIGGVEARGKEGKGPNFGHCLRQAGTRCSGEVDGCGGGSALSSFIARTIPLGGWNTTVF